MSKKCSSFDKEKNISDHFIKEKKFKIQIKESWEKQTSNIFIYIIKG